MSRPDFLELLSERGWYRSRDRWDLTPAGHAVDLDTDPVATRLRRHVSVYSYRSFIYWDTQNIAGDTKDYTNEELHNIHAASGAYPRVYFETDLSDNLRGTFYDADGSEDTRESWPKSSDELVSHLEVLIPLLQSRTHRFFNSASDGWFEQRDIRLRSEDQVYADAYLHVEVWKCEDEGEKPVWVLTALRPGQRVPDYDIEWSVHDLVVNSRESERAWEFGSVKRILEDDFQWDDDEPVITEERREEFEKAVDTFGREEYYDRLDNPEKYKLRDPKFY